MTTTTTNKHTHTPGPWIYHEHKTETARITNGEWDSLRIADVWCSDLDDGANAKLIAAAPMMLETLKEIINSGIVFTDKRTDNIVIQINEKQLELANKAITATEGN